MKESIQNNIFNHFKLHTQYSICEGAIKIEDLKDLCKRDKIRCLGISDTHNMCGALEFSECVSKSGTQPIIGTQINSKIIFMLKFKDTKMQMKSHLKILTSNYQENMKFQ